MTAEELIAKYNTGERDFSYADLRDADLRGANLRDAILIGASLIGANLSGASLSGASLSGANLSDASLSYADLRYTNLSGASLIGADLRDAILIGANLRDASLSGANLSDAKHNWKVPVIPDIHRAIYDAVSKPDSFDMGAWHRCKTTHCRAGWAIHLAGEAGYLLESICGPSVAGALIYQASDPTLERVPDWTASNTDAMADIKRLAGVVDGPPAGEEREG